MEFTEINQEKDIQILKSLNAIQNNQNEFERKTDTHKGNMKEDVTIPKLALLKGLPNNIQLTNQGRIRQT